MHFLPRAIAVVALALLVSAASGQDEPRRYDLGRLSTSGSPANEGETRSYTRSKSQSMTMRGVGQDGTVLLDRTEKETLTAEWVERFEEVSDTGVSKRKRIHVRRWQHEESGEIDTVLAGRDVDVTGTSWKLADDVPLSAEAKEWVQKNLLKRRGQKGDRDDAVPDLLAPDSPVAVNDTWPIDPEKFLEMLKGKGKPPFELADRPGAGTGKLAKVEGSDADPVVHLEYRLEIGLESMGSGPRAMALNEGSKLLMTIHASGPLAGVAPMRMVAEGEFAGTCQASGMDITFSMEFEMTSSTDSGGELPEPKTSAEPEEKDAGEEEAE